MKFRNRFSVLLLLACFAFAGCRSTYYSMMESMGKYKRDLLRDNVEQTRDEQQEASEQFKDALTQLQELYQFDGGELERKYREFNESYEDCAAKAKAINHRIEEVERVANDLFIEWAEEIQEISSPTLQASSTEKLEATKARYNSLYSVLTQSSDKMGPVLVQLNDQVLYLKHNLNAQAIGALESEFSAIEGDILSLIDEMNKSIQEANAFIATMPL